MKKRFLPWLLLAAFCLALPGAALAAEPGEWVPYPDPTDLGPELIALFEELVDDASCTPVALQALRFDGTNVDYRFLAERADTAGAAAAQVLVYITRNESGAGKVTDIVELPIEPVEPIGPESPDEPGDFIDPDDPGEVYIEIELPTDPAPEPGEASYEPPAQPEPADAPTGEPAGATGEPSYEPSPVILPTIQVQETEEGAEYFRGINTDGQYECCQRFLITNNAQISIGSVQIPIYRDLRENGFDWHEGYDDFTFYIVDEEGVPVETEVTLGTAIYLFGTSFAPGTTYAALYWNPLFIVDPFAGSWDYTPSGEPLTDEQREIFEKGMAGREDENWYEPYRLDATQQTEEGTSYLFYAKNSENYPYSTYSDFTDGTLLFFIVIRQAPDGTCEFLGLQEPMYEPMGDPVPSDEPSDDPPSDEPREVSVSFSEDGRTACAAGDFAGLYARAALVLDMNGVSGLYVTQIAIGADGTMAIPRFDIQGIAVLGVNVTLVASVEEITSPSPQAVASEILFFSSAEE